ncbi:hypothetical protein KJ707_02800 [Patescibacteria group bacterium]|nr:hypothetical protein [Patescibacteria group bacterium]
MKIRIQPEIFINYPEVKLAVLALSNINNSGSDQEITTLLRRAEDRALELLGDTSIIEYPKIASWRDAYRKFGAKPKKYPSSIENLIRRISNGENVRHINKLVDIYNIISLCFLVPVGGENIDQIKGDIVLGIACEKEKPVILLGESETRAPHPNEVIYKDDIGTICRRWNWKEVDRTKLTEDTKRAVVVIEGLPPVEKDELNEAMTQMAQLITKYCGGSSKSAILDKNRTEFDLD